MSQVQQRLQVRQLAEQVDVALSAGYQDEPKINASGPLARLF